MVGWYVCTNMHTDSDITCPNYPGNTCKPTYVVLFREGRCKGIHFTSKPFQPQKPVSQGKEEGRRNTSQQVGLAELLVHLVTNQV